ncbi:MAG: Ig-like domain-containing protein, partial [Planctomycetes bacterium]|nr:Ig-like domain-containing protein [Planctomycetota bacterium]
MVEVRGKLRAAWCGLWALLALFAGCSGSGGGPQPQALLLEASATTVPLGVETNVVALLRWSDGTLEDVTAVVQWSIDAEAVLVSAGAGRMQSAGVGVANVQAVHEESELDATLAVQVTAAELVELQVTPTAPSIAAGTTRQFTATGTYTDASTFDVTATVQWSSSDAAVASIGASGLLTGNAIGSATVTAEDAATGITATASLSVTAAVLVSIDLQPTAPSIALGTGRQMTAVGTFSDASTQDLTSQVSWSTSNGAVATVGVTGLIASVGIGSTPVEAAKDGVVGSTTVTVTAAELVSIAVTPGAPSIALGTTRQFTATGTYTDS